MRARLALRAALSALVITAGVATFWINLTEPRIVVLGVPLLALLAVITQDDPPGSRIRHAGSRTLAAMTLGGLLLAAVAWRWPPAIDPRDVFVFAAAMNGALAAGVSAVIWYAVRLAAPERTRRIPLEPTLRLAPYRTKDLHHRALHW